MRGQTGEPRFAGLLSCRDYMGHKYKFRSLAGRRGKRPRKLSGSIGAAHFFIISPRLLFRRDQRNRTLVLYAFPAVSSRRWLGAKLKFVCCRHAFIESGVSLNNALSSGRCVRRQISFNACNQLWNADRLGKKWMSLDLQARSCLSFRHQSRRKDSRCSVQCRIGFNIFRATPA